MKPLAIAYLLFAIIGSLCTLADAMKAGKYRIYHDPVTNRMVFMPHGLERCFKRADGPLIPAMGGLVARAVLQSPDGERRLRERISDLLQRLIHSQVQNCFLIDRAFEPGDEPVKICVRDGRPVEFRQRIAAGVAYDFCGESVGFFRFSGSVAARLAERADYYYSAGFHAEPYEEAIRGLVLETPEAFGFEDVSGVPWIEIDFPEDVCRAESEILPRLVD